MKSIALALATISFASTPAMAGVYLNAESRDGYTGSDYTGRAIDLHVGYEGEVGKLGYYVQGGPQISAVADVDGSETTLSGKLGGKYNLTQRLDVYGELSGTSNDEADNNYNTKIGAKFKF